MISKGIWVRGYRKIWIGECKIWDIYRYRRTLTIIFIWININLLVGKGYFLAVL